MKAPQVAISRSTPFLAAIFALLFSAAGCGTPSKAPSEGAPSDEVTSEVGIHGGLETIAILGTNDIHGSIVTETMKTREEEAGKATEYQVGGLQYLASYVKILKSEFGDRLLWLDGGDEFQGSIESNLNKGKALVEFFNAAGLHAAAIGNHEFDFGPEDPALPGYNDVLGALKMRIREAKYPYMGANIFEKNSGKLARNALPGMLPHTLRTVGKLKVGIIGLATLETPTTTRTEFVASLKFTDLREATLKSAEELRAQGADLVVVVSHVGLKCEFGKLPRGHILRKPQDPQGGCGRGDEMVKYVESLPVGTVDAVVSGHSHQVVHHWINGVPVIQGGAFGRYFNLIYLTYDWNQKKLLPDLTRIEGPVPVCPAVFQNQNDCNGDRPAPKEGRGELVVPRFHRQDIKADSAIESLMRPYVEKAAGAKKEIWGHAEKPLIPERFKESPLGGLIADSLRAYAKADVGIINPGGVRAPIADGPITYGAIFRTLPFDNAVMLLNLTGKELKTILRIGLSGARGYVGVSGIRARLIDPSFDAPSTDLSGNGKIEPWEINRLIDVQLSDGRTIQDQGHYTLAIADFLVTGGDDFGWIMDQIPETRKKPLGILMRDAFSQYVRTVTQSQGAINSAQHPLIDPAKPRLAFEKPKAKPGRSKKARSPKKKQR